MDTGRNDPAGRVATLDLPGLKSARDMWKVRAPHACLYAGASIQLPVPRQTRHGNDCDRRNVRNGAAPLRKVEFRIERRRTDGLCT